MQSGVVTCALVLLLASACQSVGQTGQTLAARDATSEPKVRVHALFLTHEENWYEGEFRHAHGADVEVTTRKKENGVIEIEIRSIEERKTSGCALTFSIGESEHGEPNVGVSGTWRMDARPRSGVLTAFEGDIYLSKDWKRAEQLHMRFALAATRERMRVVLMGGVSVEPRNQQPAQ